MCCICAKAQRNQRDKFEKRVKEGVGLGSQHGLNRIWSLRRRKVVSTKHTAFEKRIFPLSEFAVTKPKQDVLAEMNQDDSRAKHVRAITNKTAYASENTEE